MPPADADALSGACSSVLLFFDHADRHLHKQLLQNGKLCKQREVPTQGNFLVVTRCDTKVVQNASEASQCHFVDQHKSDSRSKCNDSYSQSDAH